MNPMTKNRVKPMCVSLLISSLFLLMSLAAQATPPTPPVQLQLPKMEELAGLKPEKGVFSVPVRIRAHQDVAKLTLIVRTTTKGIPGRRGGQSKEYALRGLAKGETQPVEIKIPAQQQDGLYRIEAGLQIERDGKMGVVSKGVLIEVVEKGQPRLTTPVELRRTQVSQKNQVFQEALAKKPKQPNIRLLMDSTVPVPQELEKNIKPYTGIQQRQAHPSGLPAAMQPYVIDKGEDDKTEDSRLLQKPRAVPVPLLRVSGHLVFEDWYTDTLGNPVFTHLANVLITVIVIVPGGYHAVVATTVTDELGAWSAMIDPSFQGYDVYYSVALVNDSFAVRDTTGSSYYWASSTRTADSIVDFGQETFTTNVEAAQVFAVINRGWNHIVTEGGQDPGHVEVQYPAVYTHWDVAERVDIEAGHENVPDVILHEYGHALLYYAFGGNEISPGGPHTWNELLQDTGLAFSEGWAHAFALSVCPDGQFTEDEGSDEGPGDWPICTNQTQSDIGVTVERFILAGSRLGEQNEGRVAAAINDLLDAPNDDNLVGGIPNEDVGRTVYEDANAVDRISLATIYRNHMWGFLHTDFQSFYGALLGDLSGTTKSLTSDILLYNWMGILTGPFLCVASKVAMATSPNYAVTLDGLRAFRDTVMKPLVVGRHWMQSYYSHSPEMAILLIGDSKARQAGQVIVEHFSRIGHTLKEAQGLERLSQSQEPVLPPRVIESIKKISKAIDAKGSAELKQKLTEAREFLKTFQGLSVSQAVQKVSVMEKAGRGKEAPRVQPMKLAPGSQHVDWDLITKNLPKGEWPGTKEKMK
ncbi:MAG: hypothetical protein AB7P17_12220 [Nitrospirales bacterium]|nr:hypothetical protein [Nitrospirales bacterium]